MDFDWDPDEPPPSFHDPSLPSFVDGGGAYGSFGDLFNGEIIEEKDNMTQSTTSPWSLEEVGYTYVAPHVDADGRIDGALHPPDYYAYFMPTSSWSDGLQEIEDFDWSDGKKTEQDDVAQQQSVEGRGNNQTDGIIDSSHTISPAVDGEDEGTQNVAVRKKELKVREDILNAGSADASRVTSPGQNVGECVDHQVPNNVAVVASAESEDAIISTKILDAVDSDVVDDEETISRPYAKLDDPVQKLEPFLSPISKTFAPEITPPDATHMSSASPPWIPEPATEKASALAPASLPIEANIEATSVEINEGHVEALEQMDIHDDLVTSMIEPDEDAPTKDGCHTNTDTQLTEEPAAEVVEDYHSVGKDVADNTAPETASVAMDSVALSEIQFEESLELGYVLEQSLVPKVLSSTVTSKDVVAAYSKPDLPTLLLVEDTSEEAEAETSRAPAQMSARESLAPGPFEEQVVISEVFRDTGISENLVSTYSKPTLKSSLHAEDGSEEPSETPTASAQERTQDLLELGPFDALLMVPEATCDTNTPGGGASAYSKLVSPSLLEPDDDLTENLETEKNQPMTDQEPVAQEFASEASVDPVALARANDDLEEPWQSQTGNDPSLGGLSELLPPDCPRGLGDTAKATDTTDTEEEVVQASSPLANAAELPPYHFEPTVEALEPQDVEMGVQQDSATSRSQSEVHSLVIDNVDEMKADDLKSAPVADDDPEDPAKDATEDKLVAAPAVTGSDSIVVDQPELSAPKSKAKTVNPRKRSKPIKKSKDVSETEEESPPKKKARKSASVKPRTSRAKRTKLPDEQEDDMETPPPKKMRGATKSKKESLPIDAVEAQPPRQDDSTSKFGHFALWKYAYPDGQMIFGTLAEQQQPDYDSDNVEMESHFTDAETLSSSKRDRLPVSNRELESLSTTKYRERPSQARSRMSTEERFISLSPQIKKPDFYGTLMSSAHASALQDSPSVLPKNDNSFFLVEPATNNAASPPKVAESAVLSKSKASALKKAQQSVKKTPTTQATSNKKAVPVQEAEEVVAPDQVEEEEEFELFPAPKINVKEAVKKPPAARTRRQSKATPVAGFEEEESEPEPEQQAEDEADVPELFPAPKLETKQPATKEELPPPPKLGASAARSARNKKATAEEPDEEAVPSVEDEPMADESEQDDELDESDDGKDTFDPRAVEEKDAADLSDEAAIANVKKGKPKNKLLGIKSKSASPSPSAASSGTPSANKYGFTPPRDPKTRQARKAAAQPASKSQLAPQVKAPVKGKSKTRKFDVDAEAEATDGEDEDTEPKPTIKPTLKTKAKTKAKKSSIDAKTAADEVSADNEAAPKTTANSTNGKAKNPASNDGEDAEFEHVAPKTTRKSAARKLAPKKPKSQKFGFNATFSAGAPSTRQTRGAVAREQEIQAEERLDRREASGRFKLRLRDTAPTSGGGEGV